MKAIYVEDAKAVSMLHVEPRFNAVLLHISGDEVYVTVECVDESERARLSALAQQVAGLIIDP